MTVDQRIRDSDWNGDDVRDGAPALEPLRQRVNSRHDSLTGGRAEAQLRARVAELEAQLGEVAGCLEDAENRAAEVLALGEHVGSLKAQLVAAERKRAAEVFALGERVGSLEAQLVAAERKLTIIVHTRTWRYTTPVRTVGKHVRRLFGP